jgi:hypothetical protein
MKKAKKAAGPEKAEVAGRQAPENQTAGTVKCTTGELVKVDPDTLKKLSGRSVYWSKKSRFAYICPETGKTILLKHFALDLLSAPKPKVIYKNGDPLDCRRENLEVVPAKTVVLKPERVSEKPVNRASAPADLIQSIVRAFKGKKLHVWFEFK